MNKTITFDDVLIQPRFSNITSRAECNTSTNFLGINLDIPILSANMDTITDFRMATAMRIHGGYGVIHRFNSIEDNVKEFLKTDMKCIVSVGTFQERERAKALYEAGARYFCIDVAHAANKQTVDFYQWLSSTYLDTKVIVGNFATLDSVKAFVSQVTYKPNAVKVGIGGGSMCTTREVTGIGVPQLSAIMEIYPWCKSMGIQVISDGGHKKIADVCKALVYSDVVMLGGMIAGTEETPGKLVTEHNCDLDKSSPAVREEAIAYKQAFKQYRGSASKESYEDQGKTADHRTPEGVATIVLYKGSIMDILTNIKAGIQSSMSYVNAKSLTEYKENAIMIEISRNSAIESGPHGVK